MCAIRITNLALKQVVSNLKYTQTYKELLLTVRTSRYFI